jgi:hemolysin activation/secretion protein
MIAALAFGRPAGAQSTEKNPPRASASAASEAAAEARFDVFEYRVLGNTVLSNRDIESVLYPLLGERKTLADVEVARAALEKAFHDHGFSTVFVDIPEQDVAEKIVRLKVTEGKLHEVHIAGARYFSERKILAAVPAATVGAVPNLPVLQQQLSTVNYQTADRAVVPILKAGPVPGTVDLALKVDDHLPLHGSLELNNQSTPGTKPLRASAALSYSNLFAEFDSMAVQYQVAPQNTGEVNVVAANYAWGPFESGLRPSVSFINSNSNVETVGTLGVIGKGQIYGTRFGFPITDAPGMPQSLTLGADYKHFRETIGLPSSPALVTPISYVNLSLAYGGNWVGDPVQGALAATANFGPRGAPNDTNSFANKRYKGYPNYFYMKLDGSLYFRLPKAFLFSVRADGQFAVEPLITNENYSISGADGVRGYLEAESLSDSGIKGSAQLQSPPFVWQKISFGDVFVFYDEGHAMVIDPLQGQAGTTTLRSWGGGLHLLPGKWLNGSLTWADPLVNGPNTRHGDSRLLFVVRGMF